MKKVLLFLLFTNILIASCQNKIKIITNSTKSVSLQSEDRVIELPVLTINKKEFTKIDDLYFKHSVGGKPIEEETEIMMKYDDKYLQIKFECRNNPRLDQNYYTEDNSRMFTQEIFELFISNSNGSVKNYLEIELNPNNSLFLGKITYDNGPNLELLDTKSSGIVHKVVKDHKNKTWNGYLHIPFKLLNYPEVVSDNTFRLNMYRIISNIDHKTKNWTNNATNSTFACWSSTMAKTPQFHAPNYFGYLILN